MYEVHPVYLIEKSTVADRRESVLVVETDEVVLTRIADAPLVVGQSLGQS